MTQEPVKLRRMGPLRAAGIVAGVLVLGVALWWGATSRRAAIVAPAPIVASAPPAAPAPPVTPPSTATPPAPPSPTAPPAPSTGASVAPPPPVPPSFDIVRVSPQGAAVIAGRAAPGAEVSVRQNGQEIGHARADQQGQFVVLPDKPVSAGAQELTLSARSGDQPAVSAAAPVIVVVPAAPPAAQPAPLPLVVLAPPNAPPSVLQAPAPAGPAPARKGLALGVVDYDSGGAIRFSGSADPASPVQVYVDNHALGQVTASAGGVWAIGPTTAVAPGNHVLRLDQLGATGAVIARVEVPFRRVPANEIALSGTQSVIVQPGESLWRIARRIYGAGIHYTDIYQANLSQIRNPDLIFPGQVFATPARAVDANPVPSSSSR